MLKTRKVVIIGSGHVGSHVALNLIQSSEADEIALIDIVPNKAAAQAMDLDDGIAGALCRRDCRVYEGTYEDLNDASFMVVAFGRSRKPGETRLDMFDDSIRSANEVLGHLKKVNFKGIMISISNPADIICEYIRRKMDWNPHRCFSTGTSLETFRLMRVVLRKISLDELQTRIRRAGDVEIDGKGCTEFGIGNVAGMLISAIQHDQKLVWPCSTVLTGEYGQKDVACGVPCVLGRKGIEKVLEVKLLPEEQEKLNKSCDILRSFLERADSVK